MSEIRFSEMDSSILYSIPEPGVDLTELIRYYCFINRDAPPSYTILTSCLSKAAAAGILTVSSQGRYSISERWYQYIHQFDNQTANEIESLIAFDEMFTAQTWPAVAGEHVRLNENDYKAALALLRR